VSLIFVVADLIASPQLAAPAPTPVVLVDAVPDEPVEDFVSIPSKLLDKYASVLEDMYAAKRSIAKIQADVNKSFMYIINKDFIIYYIATSEGRTTNALECVYHFKNDSTFETHVLLILRV